jgi:hypothetical protein
VSTRHEQRSGTVCGICPYDWHGGPVPEPGHYLRTTAGSYYLILEAKVMTRSRVLNRYRLTCLRVKALDVPAHATVLALRWYSRDRKR